MPTNNAADSSDLILDDDDDPSDLFALPPHESSPWRILIVDDDVDVHVVTKFALSNTHFQGRRLSFLHAYSGADAIAILRDTPDVALMLLDVIMETPEAGLQVARQVREELDNQLVRIVLRTGQPGQALEHSIIVDYDINDFWCKADLTTRKLFTTVISSLRAYATLADAAAARDALSVEVAHARHLRQVVDQHALVLTLDADARIADANELLCKLAGIPRASLIGRSVHALHPAPFPEALAGDIVSAIERTGGWAGDIHTTLPDGQPLILRCAALSFKAGDGVPHEYVAVATKREPC